MLTHKMFLISNLISGFFLVIFALKISNFRASAWFFYLLGNIRYIIVASAFQYNEIGMVNVFGVVSDMGFYLVLNIIAFILYIKVDYKPKQSSWLFLISVFVASSFIFLLYNYLMHPVALSFMWSNMKLGVIFVLIDMTSLVLFMFKRLEGFLLFAFGCFSDFYYSALVNHKIFNGVYVGVTAISMCFTIAIIFIMTRAYIKHLDIKMSNE